MSGVETMAQAMLNFFEKFEEDVKELREEPRQEPICSDLTDQKELSTTTICQAFPRQPTDDKLANLIEYRIKVLSSNNEVFESGQSKKIETNIRIGRKPGRLSLLLKPADNLELRLMTEGFISPMLRGKIPVELQNPSLEGQHLPAGSIVGYLILTPFIRH